MASKKEIFDDIKAYRNGLPFSQQEVVALDAILDRATPTLHKLNNVEVFWTALRAETGPFREQVQVDTINRLLISCAPFSIGHTAYVFATAWHEALFKPISEWGKGKGRPYAKLGRHGQSQYGRGLVQLTWDSNYEWADKACADAGLIKPGEILANFDLVLRPDIAAYIAVEGMRIGAFCKDSSGPHTLARHIKSPWGTYDEFVSARRIINGVDKAGKIAGHAGAFSKAFIAGGWA